MRLDCRHLCVAQGFKPDVLPISESAALGASSGLRFCKRADSAVAGSNEGGSPAPKEAPARAINIAVALLLAATSAAATGAEQASPGPSESPGPPVAELPQVLVTATNSLAESQALPAAVTTLSARELDQAGVYSLLDLPQEVPNLSLSHIGARGYAYVYSVRGLENTPFLSDPAVVLYVDDAPSGDVLSYQTDLLAVDRVEVYRGPQGTSFGKNAEAGVINVFTRQPGNQLEAEARASVASFNSQQYQALAMGPLAKDELFFNLAGQFSRSDGYIQNAFLHTHADELHELSGRAALKWMPSTNWQFDFTATGNRFDDGVGLVPLNAPTRTTYSDFDGKLDERINSQSLSVRGEVSGLAFASITTRRDFELDPSQFDLDFSPATGNISTASQVQIQWSEELRLRPAVPGEYWNWHAGFYFSRADTHSSRRTDLFITPPGFEAFDLTDSDARSDTYAAFGECSRKVGENWEITLGLRLDETARELDRTHTSTFGSVPPGHDTGDFFNAAPKLTLACHLSNSVLVYGSTGLGFKAGGFSPYIDPPLSPEFQTERAWASELGIKSAWPDGRLTANAAVFYNDITDYQVEEFVPNSLNFTIVNAPHARSLGAEIEVAARPTKGWEFTGFAGYTDARLEQYTNPFSGVTVNDVRPPYVADFNAGAAAQYNHPSGLFGRVEYSEVGDTFNDTLNTDAFKQSAYGLLGVRFGFEARHWSLVLFGENLTDKEYFTVKIPSLNAGAPGTPRTFGLMAMVRF
jgi:iron complex outermembrane receptor protein